ncbi:MAG: GxxExxY protein [Minisyncoccia bacterium]
MLNPELKLNQEIFDNPQYKAIRDGFGDALLKLGEDKNIVVLTADVKESTRVHKFSEKYKERFFECGICEQNMAVIASGLADSGKIPFISSYSIFSPGRNWEHIRTMIAYNNSNVKIAGHHSGIITGEDGVTHHATEDLAIMRALPNIKIISPCDYYEAFKATIEASKINGPVYLRFSRPETPIITTEETPFRFGKIEKFWIPRIYADIEKTADQRGSNETADKRGLLYEDFTYKLRKYIFEVYNKVGKGHKEGIYKNALEEIFKRESLNYKREPSINVEFENKIVGVYRPDFLIEDKIILEIKSSKFLTKLDKFQALSYLKASKYKLLLLVNFGYKTLQIKRIINENNPRECVVENNPRISAVIIFATGHLVYQALLAAKELEEEGIYTYVCNVHTIKPLDEETLLELVSLPIKGIVTVEDHQINGGLGSALAEFYAKNHPVRIEFIGLQDTFAESGNWQDLLKKYKINKEAIKKAVKKLNNKPQMNADIK